MKKTKLLYVMTFVFACVVSNLYAGEIKWALVKKGDPNLQEPKFAVNYDYKIMKYEVTVEQYCEFLNAVAGKMDPHSLYDKRMRINREGMAFSYKYSPKKGFENHPVTCINFLRAARFANWINNDKPSGNQTDATTEKGAYDMSGDLKTHSKDAKVWIPTEKEWYKAAYYNPEMSATQKKPVYWDFGDRSLYRLTKYPVAEAPPGTKHSANYDKKLQSTTPVGAYKDAYSEYGLFDMNGNVFEWTETFIKPENKNIRGGAWNYPDSYAFRKKRTGARIKEATTGYGFRLAAKAN